MSRIAAAGLSVAPILLRRPSLSTQLSHAQDVTVLPMKTNLRWCTELMRQMEEAARKELHLYNDYFVDVLFRSMLPRQRVRTFAVLSSCDNLVC